MHKGKKYYYVLQYYNQDKKKYVCKYIRRSDEKIAEEIVKREYYSSVYKILMKKKKALNSLFVDFDNQIENCYNRLDEGKKSLIEPIVGTAQSKIVAWYHQEYEINMSYPENLTHETDRGEMVRSKSEELIANYLYSIKDKVDYRYEMPLKILVNGRIEIIYPDFTIINLRTGEIFYLEHVSRLDLETYHDSFVWKHRAYVENRYIQEGKVIYSFESNGYPFNLRYVKNLISDKII